MVKTLMIPRNLNESVHKKDFMSFHYNNPKVYSRLRTMALQEINNGVTELSIKKLWENLRSEYPEISYNNNYHSCYARLLMANVQKLNNVFEVRTHKNH